jgi:hypothetical protein
MLSGAYCASIPCFFRSMKWPVVAVLRTSARATFMRESCIIR